MLNRKEIRLFLNYLHPYRFWIVKISLLAIICALFEAINLGAIVPLIQILNTSEEPGGFLWNILKTVFGLAGLELNFINLLIVMGILFVIGQCILYMKKRMQANLWFRFSADLKKQLFSQLLTTDIRFHYMVKTGKFIDILNRQVEYASSSVFAATEIITYLFFIVVYSAILLYISVELTVICLFIAVSSLYLLSTLVVRSKEMGIRTNEINIRLNEFITERLALIKLIKTVSAENLEVKKFDDLTKEYTKNNTDFWMNGVKIESFFQIIIFSIAILILSISTLVLSLPLAMLLVFIYILIRLTDPLRQLNARRHEIAGELASLEKIDLTLQESREQDSIRSGTSPFTSLNDRIDFDHVWFAYTQSKPVLRDISFSVHKNEMVALVGASGGGKTTIVDLIIRLIEPDSGSIKIDGTDIRSFNLSDYHAKIGFVSQESYIFNDSVLNNICYGAASVSKEQAVEAATIANAHEFIQQLPAGYETELGERGVLLSGGQKQRIALARALYKKPHILILDEATSALDSEAEKAIQQSILSIKNKYTMIAIAHRLSTIENADQIIVIDGGQIAETGTHAELISKGGVYARFYTIQYKSAENPTHS